MKKILAGLLVSAFLISATTAATLNEWSRLTESGAVQAISRDNQNETNSKLAAGDDVVSIDFMDYSTCDRLSNVKKSNNDFTALFQIPGGVRFQAESRLEKSSPQKLSWNWELKADTPQKLKESFFCVSLSKNMLGRKITFILKNKSGRIWTHDVAVPSSEDKTGWVYSTPKNGDTVIGLQIPMNHGALKISFNSEEAMLCKYGTEKGVIRIYGAKGDVKEISGKIDIEFIPYKSIPISLREAANMGFADDTENDRTGGWTDQGPENDLRSIIPGEKEYGQIGFDVIDPKTNQGKSCLVFGNSARPYFMKSTVIPINGESFNYLYFLHATAWSQNDHKVGTINVEYMDGTRQPIEVICGKDVSNWWNPANRENAKVVWRAQNFNAFTGLYLSRFPVQTKPIRSISLDSAGEIVWMVVGISGVTGMNIPFRSPLAASASDIETPYVIAPGKNWKSFRYSLKITPGSALDFSGITDDKPAGAYGRVIVKDDQFVFENHPDAPVRFFGGNIAYDANFMTDSELAVFPGRLKQLGYNAVRFHHYDMLMVEKGPELKFKEDSFDRFLKTFAEFKKQGIYITLDLHTLRTDGFRRAGYSDFFAYKILMVFDPVTREDMKAFAKKLLATQNPYTGLTLAEDPALFSIIISNENTLFHRHEKLKYPNTDPLFNEILGKAYAKWCGERNFDPAKHDKELWARFLMDSQVEWFKDFKTYLATLGVKAPLSDNNSGSYFVQQNVRANYDFVDRHLYWDHPAALPGAKDFNLPFVHCDKSISSVFFAPVLYPAACRILGKPVIATEWHFSAPNSYRGEGGAVMGSLSAFQGINGIFDFCPVMYERNWGDPTRDYPTAGIIEPFGLFSDPIGLLSSRITALFYMRGDVKPATETVALDIPEDIWSRPYSLDYSSWMNYRKASIPDEYVRLGLFYKIGTKITGRKSGGLEFSSDEVSKLRSSDTVVPSYETNYADNVATLRNNPNIMLEKLGLPTQGDMVSSTGQIRFNTEHKRFNVVTDKSEALIQEEKANKGSALAVKNNSTFSTIFAGSLDNRLLIDSKRVLILHLTDMKYGIDSKYTIVGDTLRMYKRGAYPFLLRVGTAEIALKNTAQGKAVLYALDMSGNRVQKIDFTETAGVISFLANNDLGNHSPLAYELVREQDEKP